MDISHKFLRSGSISDLPPCHLTHSRFSINADWNDEQSINTHSWSTVPLHLSFSLPCQSSIPVAFFPNYISISLKEKDRRSSGSTRVSLEPLRRRVDELPESALDFCWSGSSVAPSYLTLHMGSLSPLHSFMMMKDHTVHVLKCHLTAFSSIEFFKLHCFLKTNRFGLPCKLDVLEGIWVPIEKSNGFIPFLYISLLKVPGDLAKMTIAELKKWNLK